MAGNRLAMIRKLWRKVPLFGRLIDCTIGDHEAALREFLTILVFSTVPIWLGTYIVLVSGEKADLSAGLLALISTISHGELFIYSTTLLAPLFWIALNDPPGAAIFPSRLSHMVLIGIVNILAASSFGLLKLGKTLNPDIALVTSVVLYAVSVILLYLGTVYHNSRLVNASDIMRSQTDDFVDKFAEHKR